MCKKIVTQMEYHPGMRLLEIGPGGGALTKYLLEKPGIEYKAIEIDEEKVNYLLRTWPSLQGKIVQEDILRAALPFTERFSVIGNFPYNISSPIIFQMLEWEHSIDQITGMFQKEVAQRIGAGPGSKTYGILSVLTQAFFRVEYLFDVHENCFTPPPKVKSGVVRFVSTGNPYNIGNKKKFISLVKLAFNQRRKTLRNALKSILPEVLSGHQLLEKRAEQLSVSDFVGLLQNLPDHGKT